MLRQHTVFSNVTDKRLDGKTQCEVRFGQSFDGLRIPFGANVEYQPSSLEDIARLHTSGGKLLSGIFISYTQYSDGRWAKIISLPTKNS